MPQATGDALRRTQLYTGWGGTTMPQQNIHNHIIREQLNSVYKAKHRNDKCHQQQNQSMVNIFFLKIGMKTWLTFELGEKNNNCLIFVNSVTGKSEKMIHNISNKHSSK